MKIVLPFRRKATRKSTAEVIFGNGVFITVGAGGLILQSEPLARIDLNIQPKQLLVNGLAGRQYQIQMRDTFFGLPVWTQFATFVLTNNPTAVPMSSVTVPQRFFRAALLP